MSDQDREVFEKTVSTKGFYVDFTRIGPASSKAGEYANPITQTCWHVWQLARDHYRQNTPNLPNQPE